MSCIYLDKKHYQYIADSLESIAFNYKDKAFYRDSRQALNLQWGWIDRQKAILAFVQNLQVWNLEAYDTRYPKEKDPSFEIDYVTKVSEGAFSFEPFQFLKCLECTRYQCTDAPKFKHSEHYEIIKTLIDETKDLLVFGDPRYETSKWLIEG